LFALSGWQDNLNKTKYSSHLIDLDFLNLKTYLYSRINGSYDERNEAMMEDAEAFGIGCTVVGIVQFAISSSSIAVLNFAAQKQVIIIIIMLWNMSVDKFKSIIPAVHSNCIFCDIHMKPSLGIGKIVFLTE
jgi:hypothetical protein